MIPLFDKLQAEKLIKESGTVLDLGSGDGRKSVPFIEAGYSATLIDKDTVALSEAKGLFQENDSLSYIEQDLNSYSFQSSYDGILAINSLPFLADANKVEALVRDMYGHLNEGGFLYFTLFGPKDEWAISRESSMSFFTFEDAVKIITHEPYFSSEDIGYGLKMNGSLKKWHIIHLLYIKN